MWSTVFACRYLRSKIVPWRSGFFFSVCKLFSFLFFSSEYARMWCKTTFQSTIKMPMLLLAKTSHIESTWECSLVLVVSHLHLPLDASDLHRYNQFQTLYSLGFFYNTNFFFLFFFASMSYRPIKRLLQGIWCQHSYFDQINLYSEKSGFWQDLVLLKLFWCSSVILASLILNWSQSLFSVLLFYPGSVLK